MPEYLYRINERTGFGTLMNLKTHFWLRIRSFGGHLHKKVTRATGRFKRELIRKLSCGDSFGRISATASGANILPMSQQAKALYISMFILHGHIEVMREIFWWTVQKSGFRRVGDDASWKERSVEFSGLRTISRRELMELQRNWFNIGRANYSKRSISLCLTFGALDHCRDFSASITVKNKEMLCNAFFLTWP